LIGAPDTAINVTSRAFGCGMRLSNESTIELFTERHDVDHRSVAVTQ
jgi:hypothetical protein